MTASLTRIGDGVDWGQLGRVAAIIAPLVCVQIIQRVSGELMFLKLPIFTRPARAVVYSLMIYCMLFLGGAPQAFVYFQF
jgi:hypothetical protein